MQILSFVKVLTWYSICQTLWLTNGMCWRMVWLTDGMVDRWYGWQMVWLTDAHTLFNDIPMQNFRLCRTRWTRLQIPGGSKQRGSKCKFFSSLLKKFVYFFVYFFFLSFFPLFLIFLNIFFYYYFFYYVFSLSNSLVHPPPFLDRDSAMILLYNIVKMSVYQSSCRELWQLKQKLQEKPGLR